MGCTYEFVLTSVSNKACTYDCPDFCFRQWGAHMTLCWRLFQTECAHTWLSWLLFQIRECTHDCPFVSDCVHMTVLTSVLEFVRMTVLTCVLNRGFTHDSVLKFVSNRACTHDCPDFCFRQWGAHTWLCADVCFRVRTHMTVLTSVSDKGMYTWLSFCFRLCTHCLLYTSDAADES